MDYFVTFPSVSEILAHGPTKSSIVIENGIQIDLRVLEEKGLNVLQKKVSSPIAWGGKMAERIWQSEQDDLKRLSI